MRAASGRARLCDQDPQSAWCSGSDIPVDEGRSFGKTVTDWMLFKEKRFVDYRLLVRRMLHREFESDVTTCRTEITNCTTNFGTTTAYSTTVIHICVIDSSLSS